MPPTSKTPSRPIESTDPSWHNQPDQPSRPENTVESEAFHELDRLDRLLSSLKDQIDSDQPRGFTDVGSGAYAQQASRLAELGSLSAMFAHEVNNLMTQVGGRAQLALTSPDRQDRTQYALELALKASGQISRLADYFMSTGSTATNPATRLSEAHEQALAYLPTDLVSRFGFELSTADLPPIDCSMLGYLLLNCYRNAARAMLEQASPSGTITIQASIVAASSFTDAPLASESNCSMWNNWSAENSEASDQAMLIEITDTGIGMSLTQIDQLLQSTCTGQMETDPNQGRLFDDLSGHAQANDANEAELFEHHGIGLQVCKQIVGQAKGRLAIQSQVGAGTTVSVWLPIMTAPTNET